MTVPLILRALVAVLALPAMVAGVVPWLIREGEAARRGSAVGWVLVGAGLLLLAICVGTFYHRGRGTLAPWDPPRSLVAAGPYRLTRNPMYLGVLTHLVGWAVVTGSRRLGWYAGFVALAFHLRVVLAEEPWLARSFPAAWVAYSARVPRWLLPRRPGTQSGATP